MNMQAVKEECLSQVKTGSNFQIVFDFAENSDSGLSKNKAFYHSLAEAFAKQGKLSESRKCYEKMIDAWPQDSWGAKRRLRAFSSGIAEISDNKFFIDSPVFSDFMKFKLAGGQYETQELNILKQRLEPHDSVMELGSGVGFLGINSKKMKPSIQYCGYEANPYLIEIIKKNQELNKTFFEIKNAVLDNYCGTTNFYLTKDFWASSLVKPKHYKKEVSVEIHNINLEIKEQNINFIVMDIEGGEAELIPKIDLRPIQKILIEIHPHVIGNEGVSDIFSAFLSSGFKYGIDVTKGHVFYFYR